MQFRYLGDRDEMTAFGYDFSHGATPDVTDPHALKKLGGNAEFEAVGEEAPKRGRKRKEP